MGILFQRTDVGISFRLKLAADCSFLQIQYTLRNAAYINPDFRLLSAARAGEFVNQTNQNDNNFILQNADGLWWSVS